MRLLKSNMQNKYDLAAEKPFKALLKYEYFRAHAGYFRRSKTLDILSNLASLTHLHSSLIDLAKCRA